LDQALTRFLSPHEYHLSLSLFTRQQRQTTKQFFGVIYEFIGVIKPFDKHERLFLRRESCAIHSLLALLSELYQKGAGNFTRDYVIELGKFLR